MFEVDPAAALDRIAYLLERRLDPFYRSRAYRRAAQRVRGLGEQEIRRLVEAKTLLRTPDIGPATAEAIIEALDGRTPGYLLELEQEHAVRPLSAADRLRALLRGDCHVHTNWSDGKASIEQMASAARSLGHEYVVITDHSPRLAIARGLSAERLESQMAAIESLNRTMTPFRILTGIEVDILDDGEIDQTPDLLSRIDVVVASVHSKLRMEAARMTERMIAAVRNPHVDVLGHCTGRIVTGRGRPESTFDAERVFAACAAADKAIEINSRPERLDPPRRLLRLATELGCRFTINTDAHAPGQLEWQDRGCERAIECDVPAARIANIWSAADLLAWTAGHS